MPPSTSWSRVVNTTIADYIRGEEVNIMRNRKVTAMLKAKGRITFNHGGDYLDWKVRYKRSPMQGYADSDTLTFSRRDRWKTAQLDWRGYAATDSMTKSERLRNKSTEAIIKVYEQIGKSLMEDMEDQFGDEFYIDGNASGNTKRIHGLESFFSTSGASTKYPVGLPNDTYAGLVCTLGNYGGSWSTTGTTTTATDWPAGTGDAHYDFWAPLIVDYTSAVATSTAAGTQGWTSSTKTWPNTCKEAIRFGVIYSHRDKSRRGQLETGLFNSDLYRQFVNTLDTEERVVVSRGDGEGLLSLGFRDVINFEGLEISWEYGVPAYIGYGWNFEQVELQSMQGNLFVPEGPDFDISTQSYRFSIDFYGNMKSNPKYQVKWKNVS